jgi:Tol biopolymer transport system component
MAMALMAVIVSDARQESGGGAVSVGELFQQALHEEDAAGNPESAIALYRRVLAASPDRETAGRVQLRIALCYEKLGKPEARAALETVVKDFGDQKDVVAKAHERLAALARGRAVHDAGFVARDIWSGKDLLDHVAPNAARGFRVTTSPDGEWLAFVDWASSNVAIRNVTTGEVRLITRDAHPASAVGWKEAEVAFHPIVSPDGSQVAYEWGSRGGYSIRIAPITGGRPRVVLQRDMYVHAIRWAPDGRRLAVITTSLAPGSKDPYIALISLPDATLTRLKSLPWGANYFNAWDLGGFSPDGRFLLYSVSSDRAAADNGIFAISIDGIQQTALVQGPSKDASPAWAPDGRSVVFVSDRSTNFGLWSIRVDNGRPVGAPELLRGNIGSIQGLGVSRDGALFYGRMNSRDDVYAADIDPATAAITSKPSPLIDRSMGSNRGASWSPDNTFVAFVRSTPSGDAVVVRSADGVERTLPTVFRDGGYRFAVPTWFPDSRSLLIPEIA